MARVDVMDPGTTYPFPAIVGQKDLKLALLLNAVNPGVGGLLVRGERGTAKSTAVRALSVLLPEIEVIEGCLFSISPLETDGFCPACRLCNGRGPIQKRAPRIVTIPLNATEDRVVGGIDLEKTIQTGVRTILPGLLALAHQGILYVDEVNLLDDHLVDAILSAAASGINTIEREGLSFSHPARFALVGTMNPEEGELRPQLLDRFGLCVEVRGEQDPTARVLAMERREAFDADPVVFSAGLEKATERLKARIRQARGVLPRVVVPGRLRALIAELCARANVAGHRADLVLAQAARAMAAFSQRSEVEERDIQRVAPFVLIHRQRETPPLRQTGQERKGHHHSHTQDPQDLDQKPQEDKGSREGPGQGDDPQPRGKQDGHSRGSMGQDREDGHEPQTRVGPDAMERVFEIGATFKVRPFSTPKDRIFRRGSGRRSRSRVSGLQGRYVRSTLPRGTGDVALDATLRAAAPYQHQRKGPCALIIEPQDIRERIRERRIGNFILFVVDASGSMGARARMVATKGAVMSLLLDAYQKRDKVALITFSKNEARLVLPPTSSVHTAARLLAELPVGGRTPLCDALLKTSEVLRVQLKRNPEARPIVVLITDGRSNVALAGGNPVEESLALCRRLGQDGRSRYIVVDTEEQGLIRFGLAERIALALGATYVKMDDLCSEGLIELVSGHRQLI